MASFSVEVLWACQNDPIALPVTVAEDATVLDAILQSGILQQYPDLRLAQHVVGIYGKPCRLEDLLKPQDRIEIYAPLLCDPKVLRRQRVSSAKAVSIRTNRSDSK